MKEFNIDKLEKKTPYQIPENFFEEMQRNVLNKIESKSNKKTKTFRLNYSVITSIAAALVLVFGFTFLWKTNQTQIDKPKEVIATTVPDNHQNAINSKLLENTDVATIEEVQKTIKSVEQANNTTESKKNTVKIASASSEEKNYNELLNALSDAELAEIATNSDHDIYLELYN